MWPFSAAIQRLGQADPQRREFDCKDVKHSDWICESADHRFTRTNSLPLRLVGNKMGLVLYTMPGQRDGKRLLVMTKSHMMEIRLKWGQMRKRPADFVTHTWLLCKYFQSAMGVSVSLKMMMMMMMMEAVRWGWVCGCLTFLSILWQADHRGLWRRRGRWRLEGYQ